MLCKKFAMCMMKFKLFLLLRMAIHVCTVDYMHVSARFRMGLGWTSTCTKIRSSQTRMLALSFCCMGLLRIGTLKGSAVQTELLFPWYLDLLVIKRNLIYTKNRRSRLPSQGRSSALYFISGRARKRNCFCFVLVQFYLSIRWVGAHRQPKYFRSRKKSGLLP